MEYNDENVGKFLNEMRVIRADENAKCKDLIKVYLEWEAKKPVNIDLVDVSQHRKLLKAYEAASNPCDCDSCKNCASERVNKYLSRNSD